MDNQHQKITGYRDLTQEEIDLMNEIKALGPALEAICDKVKAHIDKQQQAAANDAAEFERLNRANPELWESWGRGSAQTVLMYLTRAVAQPSSF